MKNHEKQSLISQLMSFIFKLIEEQTPSREEFKTQPTKAILRVLLVILGVLFCFILAGIVIGFYLLSFFLKILGIIFIFGTPAEFVQNRR